MHHSRTDLHHREHRANREGSLTPGREAARDTGWARRALRGQEMRETADTNTPVSGCVLVSVVTLIS
jgi:hypothetical protein